MKDKITKKDKCFIIILIILFISFVLNCYQVMVNKRYKRIIESTCYGNVEEIRIKNESVLSILDRCIKAGNISNEELLKLYKNYSAIASAETNLLEYYLEYKDNPNIKTSNKNVTIENENINGVYWQIEEVIYNYIKSDLSEKAESIFKQKTPYVTYILIAINVLIFFLCRYNNAYVYKLALFNDFVSSSLTKVSIKASSIS